MTRDIVVGGDFGGTNARLQTLNENGEFVDPITFPRQNYAGPLEVMKEYEQRVGGRIVRASLAVAGLVLPNTDTIQMSNGWTFSLGALSKEFGRVKAMNDFTPVSYAVMDAASHPESANVVKFGGDEAKDDNIVVIGPGTGLGVAFLIKAEGKYHSVEGEVCFTTVHTPKRSISTEKKQALLRIEPSLREEMILRVVADKYEPVSKGHVSIERICCGPGLVDLHDAICVLENRHDLYGMRNPAAVSSAALAENPCPVAREALDMMMHYLGRIMGDLATQHKATGGVYIASHIINKIMDSAPDYLGTSPMRKSFETKGRGEVFMKSIPIFVLRDREPAFSGLKVDLQQQLALEKP